MRDFLYDILYAIRGWDWVHNDRQAALVMLVVVIALGGLAIWPIVTAQERLGWRAAAIVFVAEMLVCSLTLILTAGVIWAWRYLFG